MLDSPSAIDQRQQHGSDVMDVPILIPAYQPEITLPSFVGNLLRLGVRDIVVVDDGSGAEFAALFDELRAVPEVTVLRHAINLGKGAALKSAINHVLCNREGLTGVVTADADGQHHPEDVVNVGRALEHERDKLILGARHFPKGVPLRSRFGNELTRFALYLFVGQHLSDTQTGLRGIPVSLLPRLLRLVSNGYEFELDMLIACKHMGCGIFQVPIRTIYLNDNKSSHFNPLLDSMRIYFVLCRFAIISGLTALLDNGIFFLAYWLTHSIAEAQVLGRLAAVAFNYTAARRLVFLSQQSHGIVFPKYLLLVVCSGFASYLLIRMLHTSFGIDVFVAKITAETILFLANFAIQRDFVFTRHSRRTGATDWDQYYQSTPPTAKLTRKYTEKVLLDLIRRFAGQPSPSIAELGGANSCFMDRLLLKISPSAYHVIDNNQYGLSLLERRAPASGSVHVHYADVLDLNLALRTDVVFSVGLIEHFDPEKTREAILAHFALVKPGGCAIISFPTPTLLYRSARSVCEALGLWKFPDERPLSRGEVLETMTKCGHVLYEKTLWPLVFTQRIIVVRAMATGQDARTYASPYTRATGA